MGTTWQGRGAPAAALAGRFGSVTGAAAARSDDGSQAAGGDVGSQAAGEPAVVAAATSPTESIVENRDHVILFCSATQPDSIENVFWRLHGWLPQLINSSFVLHLIYPVY